MNTVIDSPIQRINKQCLYISIALVSIEFILFILIKLNVFESMDFAIKKSLHPGYNNISTLKDISIPKILTIINYLNKIFVPYIIIIIVNNFSNIYYVFNLFNILSINCYISCILKFIFYKIIKNDNEGIIYYCGEGWNLPSTEMMISVSFYMTLWNLFFDNKDHLSICKKVLKFTFLGLIIFYNILNLLCLTKIGYYLFSHLIFSAIFGVLIYIFIFKTNIIKKYNPKEFCIFLKKKFEFYSLINIFLLIFPFIPYIIERNIKSYNPSKCNSVEGTFFYNNNSPYITYVDETFNLISVFFANFFVIGGIKCELGFFFGNNILNFEQYHFGVNIDDLNDDREYKNKSGTIIVTRDTEWNNTSVILSIIRLILTFLLSGVCFLPYVFVNNEADFSTIFLVKHFLSYALFSFGISFFFKIIFRIFKLSNEILRSIMENQ